MRYFLAFLFLLFVSCKTETNQKAETSTSSEHFVSQPNKGVQPPDVLLGSLFIDVQLQEVFPDSKTFVDCTAKYPYEEIRVKYNTEKKKEGFDLKQFVASHFDIPPSVSSDFKSDPNKSAVEHVKVLWPVLKRESDSNQEGSTLIPLPKPYIVPGGRFREVYYWDSYFTMLGLVESGEFELIGNMLDNFAHLIETVGHIPNGNRTYYITRSQPPFFAQMVKLLAKEKGDTIYTKYKEALKKEYEFWMDGRMATNQPIRHCVNTPNGIVNRYYDSGDTPRQESYREDFFQIQKLAGGKKMYRDLRSGAESGWDYTSRWFANKKDIETIETTDIIPVDLNALLYGLEEVLTVCYADDAAYVAALKTSMANRATFLDTYCWNAKEGIYEDFNWVRQQRTGVQSLAMVYPLYFKMTSQIQADAVAGYIKEHFLKPGGVVTTLNNTGEQWDAPNGWAPLQWMTIIGLENYGHHDLARTIAERWVALNEKVYRNTGKFVEKYNVEDMGLEAGGGEYPLQDGFGWSNGVYLALKSHLEKK
ncbi:alpha,alpha-trehalase TreF [Flavobacteriaceae bacterium TP-CH-4]|uniref:Alpha,alpha-trehalase TreF n=1 Tax=Pelagihabitans pacificus TaxID=2696054 RepID=A0A967E5W5_9FLAO|nr:alpha,alpha-trehalase TreF [Pelagihabitans pacificus]NHF58549.1 alpha,alpha-trehalase TreF [Pelagihabitans pacificus]